MNKLSSLQAFITVVETENFSETARRLGVSKALISKQVAQLETSLGVRLLHRTTRRVSPTSSGQAYYERSKPLLVELNELDDSLTNSDRALQGELRISAPTTFAEMHLLPIISAYSEQNPEVHVKLELTDRFINLVDDRIDLAIRIGQLEESSLVARKIGEIRMMLCAAPEFIHTHGLPESPQELSDMACVLDSNYPGGNQWQLKTAQGQQTVTVNGHISVNNARAVCDLVRQGKGIGFLPSFVVNDYIRRGELINILKDHTPDSIGIYTLYLHRKHLSQKVRKMLDLLIDSTH